MDMIIDNTTANLPQSKKRRRTRNDWLTLVEAWERSGKTQRAFCEDRGLCYRQLSQWKSRFKLERAGESAATEFIPVHVKPSSEGVNKTLQIVLPNGICLELADESQLSLLSGVARALMTLSC